MPELKKRFPYLKDLPNITYNFDDVKMIIGQDMYQLIHPMDYKQGKEDEPWAVRTHFGWTVSGPLPKKLAQSINVSSNLVHVTDPLSEQVKRWWEIEAYASNVKSSGKSLEEKKAL